MDNETDFKVEPGHGLVILRIDCAANPPRKYCSNNFSTRLVFACSWLVMVTVTLGYIFNIFNNISRTHRDKHKVICSKKYVQKDVLKKNRDQKKPLVPLPGAHNAVMMRFPVPKLCRSSFRTNTTTIDARRALKTQARQSDIHFPTNSRTPNIAPRPPPECPLTPL